MSGGRLLSAAGLITSIVAFALPASALADDTVIEGENLTWPTGSGKVYNPDPSNAGVVALALWTNTTASGTVTPAKTVTGVQIKVRTDQHPDGAGVMCQGNPQFSLKVDGTVRATWTLAPSNAYSTFTVDSGGPPLSTFTITPGIPHTVGVSLNNDHDSQLFPCDRNLWIDKVTLIASQLFPDASWRNAPLAADASLDPDQSPVADLVHQVTKFGTWVNSKDWTVPVYTVSSATSRVQVKVDDRWHTNYDPTDEGYLGADLASVPVPSNAQSAGPCDGTSDGETIQDCAPWSDREIAIYQPSTDTLWEMYHFVKHNGSWSVTDGGRISHVSQHLRFDPWPSGTPHGVAATRIPLLATLQRTKELVQDHEIRHPITIHVPHVPGTKHPGVPGGFAAFVAPAEDSDGDWNSTVPSWDGWAGIEEGTRFRLPASLDIDALGLNDYAEMVAKAAQRYGMIVTDKDCWPSELGRDTNGNPVECGTGPATMVEDWTPQGSNPYTTLIPNPGAALAGFPWAQLQVVAPVSSGS